MAALRGRTASFVSAEATENEQRDDDGEANDEATDEVAEWKANAIENRNDLIMSAIEGEILPRLLIAQGQDHKENTPIRTGVAAVKKDAIDCFAQLLTKADASAVDAFVDAHLAGGMTLEGLLLDLFAPTARELGDMWLRDDCSFTEVTIGLCALECQLMRRTESDQRSSMVPAEGRLALFSPVPGEQHVFGLLIVKELFRRAGWIVSAPASTQEDALLDAVQQNWFTMVGLSVSSADAVKRCVNLIPRIRVSSQNPDVVVVVGGHCLDDEYGKTEPIGADLIVSDGPTALVEIERLVDQRTDKQIVH
ncbi:MAG: cobalamin B12-binding domain-containing protein [Pseudomonadota bacterium]